MTNKCVKETTTQITTKQVKKLLTKLLVSGKKKHIKRDDARYSHVVVFFVQLFITTDKSNRQALKRLVIVRMEPY